MVKSTPDHALHWPSFPSLQSPALPKKDRVGQLCGFSLVFNYSFAKGDNISMQNTLLYLPTRPRTRPPTTNKPLVPPSPQETASNRIPGSPDALAERGGGLGGLAHYLVPAQRQGGVGRSLSVTEKALGKSAKEGGSSLAQNLWKGRGEETPASGPF